MAIRNTTITSVASEVYHSNGGSNAITTIIVCNKSVYNPALPTENQSMLYMYAVPAGSSADNTNIIVNGLPIPAGETVSFEQERLVLGSGDKLYARTDNLSNLVVTVSTLAV